jgi:hypothetical protein
MTADRSLQYGPTGSIQICLLREKVGLRDVVADCATFPDVALLCFVLLAAVAPNICNQDTDICLAAITSSSVVVRYL